MTAKQASIIDKCINDIERRVNAKPPGNQVDWLIVADDIELRMQRGRTEIVKLREARNQALENAADGKVFRWEDHGFPPLTRKEAASTDARTWSRIGWESHADDIDLMIEVKQAQMTKLGKAQERARQFANNGNVFDREEAVVGPPHN